MDDANQYNRWQRPKQSTTLGVRGHVPAFRFYPSLVGIASPLTTVSENESGDGPPHSKTRMGNGNMHRIISLAVVLAATAITLRAAEPDTLPGTEPLTVEGDIAAQMVAGIDKFLLRKIDESVEKRKQHWVDLRIPADIDDRKRTARQRRLMSRLGIVPRKDKTKRVIPSATIKDKQLSDDLNGCRVRYLRIPVLPFSDELEDEAAAVHVNALFLQPVGRSTANRTVFIPGEDDRLESFLRPEANLNSRQRIAYQLARNGENVIIPILLSRSVKRRGERIDLEDREFVYRSSFELGRHPIGYELEKVLACASWIRTYIGCRFPTVKYYGYGEGGLMALYAGALDNQTTAICVRDYFQSRNGIWREPIDRNIFGLLTEFGDAEIAAMALPAQVVIDASHGLSYRLSYPQDVDHDALSREMKAEFARLGALTKNHKNLHYVEDSQQAIRKFLGRDDIKQPKFDPQARVAPTRPIRIYRTDPQEQQVAELVRYNAALLAESPYVRKERFWDKLDYSSVEAFEKSVTPFREQFKHDVIGHFDDKPLPFNPRTRKAYDEEKWVGYEVMLDLWPDVFCYGILCLPKDMKTDGSERRPVVVCQHGLEGRPQDIVAGDHPAYHDFASRLCERGFITFAPQNLYIGGDKFRTLQRKANPLGKTLFSIITPQHQQILDWLQTLPYVDGERIGFYGLSYGGKTAMRVPPLVDDYKCVICSADFNDWVWKCASTRSPYSYVWTGEYEIFEWNLAHTFNYAEMAALIAPRPFMVERGHFDGVAPDERVAYEFAKVRHLYNARLKLPADHCQIEWFDGPHTIHGVGTFAFLHEHLDWPPPEAIQEKEPQAQP